jgi:CheY-like chemotaxis protein
MSLTQKILIIDGHPVYAKKTEAFLKGLTFSDITIAPGASEGLKEFENALADLVVLSSMLPDGDSHEVCRTLRSLAGPSLGIVVQAGLIDQEQIQQFSLDGASRVLLRKEKDLAPLQQAVEELLFS